MANIQPEKEGTGKSTKTIMQKSNASKQEIKRQIEGLRKELETKRLGEKDLHPQAHQALKEVQAARTATQRARSALERATLNSGHRRDSQRTGAHPGRSSGLSSRQNGSQSIQQSSSKIRATNNPRRGTKDRKTSGILAKAKASKGSYDPSGMSNRFSTSTPMPTMDVSETAINHKRYGTGACIVGSEFLFSLRIDSDVTRGSILEAIPFNPRFWGGTRIQVMSGLWNRYIVKNMVLEYIPITNATENGAIQMWPDYDPDSFPAYETGDAAVRRALAYQNSVQAQVFSYFRSVFHNSDMTEAYFLDPEEGDVRLTDQGIWYMQAASDLALDAPSTSKVYGNILVHYEVDFFLRALVEPAPEMSSGVLSATLFPAIAAVDSVTTPVTWGNVETGIDFPVLLCGQSSASATFALPFDQLAVIGGAGSILFLTITDVGTIDPEWLRWQVFGKEVPMTFASQPSFWGKLISVEFIPRTNLSVSGGLQNFRALSLHPTLEAAMNSPETVVMDIISNTGSNKYYYGPTDGDWSITYAADGTAVSRTSLSMQLDFNYTVMSPLSVFA